LDHLVYQMVRMPAIRWKNDRPNCLALYTTWTSPFRGVASKLLN